MQASSLITAKTHSRIPRGGLALTILSVSVLLSGSGCSSFFNQSFVNLVAQPVVSSTGTVPAITLDNAPGHVPVVFVNNARFDQALLDYFSNDLGIDTSDPDLRPRVRVRTDIRYVNGNTLTLEFIDGSALVQDTILTEAGTIEAGTVPTDLLENELTNIVAVCDVSVVQPGGGIDGATTSVEVFVPAFQKVIQLQDTDVVVGGEVTLVTRELLNTIPPQFVPLQQDEVDDNLNITLLRNLDIRGVPVPATDLLCGSVVGFTLSGTLRLPFVIDELDNVVPGYLDTDTTSQAAIPGRFEFQTTVR